jgi:undecaprenyl-diphosphatase
VLFGVSALLIKIGAVGWDLSLFRILNQVPAAAASVLTPLSHVFLPAGILVVIVLTIVYVVARNHSVLPVAAGGSAAAIAWLLANTAKAIADRPRPYEVMASAVLRQQPAHGTSFPSSHTAVTLAVVIALMPFLARPLAAVGIGYAVLIGWSRVYLGVHYPLDILAGAGIGMTAGGVILLALGMLLHGADRAVNFQNGATERRPPRPAPERPPRDAASCRRHRAGRADQRGVRGRAGAPRRAVLAGTARVACWWSLDWWVAFAFFKVPFSPRASVFGAGRAWPARA